MAIFHSTTKIISRGKGQSAVASASYRSGEKLVDEKSGEVKFYKRDVMPETMILAPEHSPEWVKDRQQLWNEVEKIEKRKDSQLAREIEIALPVELDKEEQKKFVQSYVQDNFVDKGMIADVAIHRDNPENPHAHIMLTTRDITPDGFGKKNRTWNEHSLVDEWRKDLADRINHELENKEISERVSHLSNEERGLETLPTKHLGHRANAMEKRGIETERGNHNREIKEYNQTVIDLQKYREAKQQLERKVEIYSTITKTEKQQMGSAAKLVKGSLTPESIDKRLAQINGWQKALSQKELDFKAIGDHYSSISFSKNRINASQQQLDSIGVAKQFFSKDTRRKKELAFQEIQRHESIINEHQRKLTPYQEKYNFDTENDFKRISEDFRISLPKQLEKLENEKQTLSGAKLAIQKVIVQDVSLNYPNQPEMAHLDYKTAMLIKDLNEKHNKIHSIDEIKQLAVGEKKAYQQVTKQISNAMSEKERLNKVDGYLKGYQEANAIVQHYEKNPLYQGKIKQGALSITDKQKYESALSDRHRFNQLLKQHHVKDNHELQEKKGLASQQLTEVPKLQEQADSLQKGSGLFDAMVQGIEQAQHQMEQHQVREKRKSKSRIKQKTLEHEMEMY